MLISRVEQNRWNPTTAPVSVYNPDPALIVRQHMTDEAIFILEHPSHHRKLQLGALDKCQQWTLRKAWHSIQIWRQRKICIGARQKLGQVAVATKLSPDANVNNSTCLLVALTSVSQNYRQWPRDISQNSSGRTQIATWCWQTVIWLNKTTCTASKQTKGISHQS